LTLSQYQKLNTPRKLKPETRNFLTYWLPALLWTALVLSASTRLFSGAQTASVLEALLTSLFGEAPRQHLDVAHFLLRKLAHLTEYGILGWLLYRARRQHETVWNLIWARFALAGVALVAITDELHQHFVPSRTGSPVDVLLDLIGGLVALAILRKRSGESQRMSVPVTNE
jgi:VanZ family protein